MNHNVQVFMRGCLTLKLETSWKTVMFSIVGWAFSSLVASPLMGGSGAGVGCMTSAMLGSWKGARVEDLFQVG